MAILQALWTVLLTLLCKILPLVFAVDMFVWTTFSILWLRHAWSRFLEMGCWFSMCRYEQLLSFIIDIHIDKKLIKNNDKNLYKFCDNIFHKIIYKTCDKLFKKINKNLTKNFNNFDRNVIYIIVHHDDLKIIIIQLLLLKIHLPKICLSKFYLLKTYHAKIPKPSYIYYYVKTIDNKKSSFKNLSCKKVFSKMYISIICLLKIYTIKICILNVYAVTIPKICHIKYYLKIIVANKNIMFKNYFERLTNNILLTKFRVKNSKIGINNKMWLKKSYVTTFIFVLNLYDQDTYNVNLILLILKLSTQFSYTTFIFSTFIFVLNLYYQDTYNVNLILLILKLSTQFSTLALHPSFHLCKIIND